MYRIISNNQVVAISRRFNFNDDSDLESVVIATSNPVTATINGGTIKIYGR